MIDTRETGKVLMLWQTTRDPVSFNISLYMKVEGDYLGRGSMGVRHKNG